MLRRKREARLKNEEKKKNEKISNSIQDELSPEQSAEWILNQQKRQLKKYTTNHKTRNKRCTGEAVAYGISLASTLHDQSNTSTTGRVLLFTNGCPNIGKGRMIENKESSHGMNELLTINDTIEMEYASQYLKSIAKEGFENNGIGIDIFCCGNSTSLGVQGLLSLVTPSDGYILTHMTFEDESFMINLRYVLSCTQLSYAKDDPFAVGDSNQNNVINGCLVDLRMPR